MSSGERKKRILAPGGARGWEEAGGEFYQESYPGAELDLEVMQNEPHRISTFLPSKKNRTATVVRDQKLTTLRHRTTLRSHYQTTVVPNNDIQIALLPDLSENLSNEKLLWEEIMKIKAMPVNMAQKKEMKSKLLSRDTLRLQGFKQFKWKKKQSLMQMKIRLKEINEKLTLWRKSLKKIEGYYGTGVVSFFLFLKWLIFLNLIISLIMLIFVILPNIYVTNFNTINGCMTDNSSIYFVNETAEAVNIFNDVSVLLNVIFNSKWMSTSPLYYAYYKDCDLNLYYLKIPLPLAYVLATSMCFIFSFISVLKNAADGFKNKLLESQGQFYVYCNVVFSGWDFCIQNEKSAKIKHKAIYNEIVGRLNVEKRKEQLRNLTKQDWCKLFFIRAIINLVVVSLLTFAGTVIFLAFKSSNEQNMDKKKWFFQVMVEFTPAGCIIFFNLSFPFIFHWLVKFEKFSPIFTVQVTIFRTILLRLSSLCVLLASANEVIHVKRDLTEKTWESDLGRELYKLLILCIVMQILYTFLINFPRGLLAKHCQNRFIQYIGKQEFDLPGHVLDVVYVQTIIWLGSFYAPLLSIIGVITFLLMFYIKKFACLVNCRPASNVYYASRSQSLYMFILFISFAFSLIPWIYSIALIEPSRTNGPFKNYDTVWTIIVQTFDKFPNWFSKTLNFCISSTVGIPVIIILSILNYYYYAIYTVNKQMVLVLKRQLILEGHDKQFLLNRLSAFIKQQQERYRHRNIEMPNI